MIFCKGGDGHGRVGDQMVNAELQGRQTPGVVSKSEKQHSTMKSVTARTQSFALSVINVCALIIVECCDHVVVFTFRHNSWSLTPLQLIIAYSITNTSLTPDHRHL